MTHGMQEQSRHTPHHSSAQLSGQEPMLYNDVRHDTGQSAGRYKPRDALDNSQGRQELLGGAGRQSCRV